MAIDPVWAGVIGTAVGVVGGSLTSLFSPLILWKTEEKRLVVQARIDKSLADHAAEVEIRTALASDRRQLISEWRQNMSSLHQAIAKSIADQEAATYFVPVGQAWWEILRPYLNAKDPSISNLLGIDTSPLSLFDTRKLFEEVARIERAWDAELMRSMRR